MIQTYKEDLSENPFITTMASKQIYYKWQNIIVPDSATQENFDQVELIRYISSNTFTEYDECLEEGRDQDYTLPDSYDGPFLCILSSENEQDLENYRLNSQDGKPGSVQEKQIDLLPELTAKKCKLLNDLDEKWAFILKEEGKEPMLKTEQEFLDALWVGGVYKYDCGSHNIDYEESTGLGWTQDLSDRTSLTIGFSDRMMHPKLYLFGKRGYRMLSLCPSEI